MKSICRMILLSAGIVLSLAGCQKGNTPGEATGKSVKFSATSGSIDTRTVFTGDGATSTSTDEFGRKILAHERINWVPGDQVMIASDYAAVPGTSTKYASYTVYQINEQGDKCYATLEEKDDNELFFDENQNSYKFWGVYPAAAAQGRMLQENHQVEYKVGQSQAAFGTPVTKDYTINNKTVTLTTLAPDMSKNAVQLAAAENQTPEKVELEFYPGFTAYEFTLNARDTEVSLQSVVLTTAEGKALAGSVKATIQSGGNSTFSDFVYYTDGKLIYTFPENTIISPTKYLTFTVLALPEKAEGLNLEFHMGDGTVTKAKLKKKADGSPIEFDGCKKHCLRGIAVPGGWKFLTLDIHVMEWTEVPLTESNKNAVQATQFAVDGADNLRTLKDAVNKVDANKDYRQCWVFAPAKTVTVEYKIMMPESGTWAIEKLGDVSDFTVNVTSSAGAVSSEGNKYSGALATGSTYITMTITSSATALKKIYFKTTASDGTSYFSLDSETQLYDMRGYHYFIVNGDVNTTFADLNIQ